MSEIKRWPHYSGYRCLVKCDNCGVEAERKWAWAKRSIDHFCSKDCLYEHRRKNPDKQPNWKGGRRLKTDGYIAIKDHSHPNSAKDGYILEHRLVMSNHLKRPLETWEVVHHVDGDKANNKLDNLELLPKQSEHVVLQKMQVEIDGLRKEIKRLKKKYE